MQGKGTKGRAVLNVQEGVTEECISERRLWTAVIAMAVQDWRNGTLRARREAQTFLFENQTDFSSVCESAGLEPDTLRNRLVKIGKKIEMEGAYTHTMAA
jgi:hypothetical protein